MEGSLHKTKRSACEDVEPDSGERWYDLLPDMLDRADQDDRTIPIGKCGNCGEVRALHPVVVELRGDRSFKHICVDCKFDVEPSGRFVSPSLAKFCFIPEHALRELRELQDDLQSA